MTEVKHTKGPWSVYEDKPREGDNGGFRIDGNGIEQIAYVWREDVRYSTDATFGSPNAKADASLISAAPDLLEALEAVHNEARREFAMYDVSDIGKQVADAIAKATGESHG